jgi:enterochelin esterase-like enzyme
MIMQAFLISLIVTVAEPISPRQMLDALKEPPSGEAARALAERIRASFPPGTDLKDGKHLPLIEGDAVAFVLEAPAEPTPRITGQVNHSRGVDMIKIGDTGLWARVEQIDRDTKFSFNYMAGGQTIGGQTVQMPDWKDPVDAQERPGMTYGEYKELKFRSQIFDNNRTGWIYVPAAYKADGPPASLLVCQDGDSYKREKIGIVVDNLIADKAMPVTILVLLNPGTNDNGRSNRSVEYDTLGDRYASFIEKEVLPLVSKQYNLRDDPSARGIAGASSGGICSFTVAWERPQLFGRVLSQIGSFTNIRGGNAYPDLVRSSPKKPIKVFLADGTNDLINRFGDWWQANNAMYDVLSEKGYDVHFYKDHGFHNFWTCGRQLPEALRWVWGDFKSP